MARCVKCGKKGLFLKLDRNRLCNACQNPIFQMQESNRLEIPSSQEHEHKTGLKTEKTSVIKSSQKNDNLNTQSFSYDFNTIEGIKKIPVPKTKKVATGSFPNVTNDIEYVLQRKATEHKKNGRMDLAIECLRKSNELMLYSSVMYSPSDYMRLVEFLKIDRQFEAAREEKAKIDAIFENIESAESAFLEIKAECFKLKTDLVSVEDFYGCCSECAKYRKRVYSLSGRDNRFPKYPQYLIENSNCCGLFVDPFLYGIGELYDLSGKKLDVIKTSNRPFKDNRSKEEKEFYQQQKSEATALKYDKENYDWLWEFYPEKCPKSFSGYRRMKKNNSLNFQKLSLFAKEQGREL